MKQTEEAIPFDVLAGNTEAKLCFGSLGKLKIIPSEQILHLTHTL